MACRKEPSACSAISWRQNPAGGCEKIAGLAVLETAFKGSRGASHQNHHVWDIVYARVK